MSKFQKTNDNKCGEGGHLLTFDRSINGNQYGGYLKTKQNKKNSAT